MSTEEKIWFSATELSLLGERLIAGLPKTMQGVKWRAKKEGWASREVKGSGGPGGILTEYQPPTPVLALIHSFLDANPEFFTKSKTRTKADLASISKEVFGDAPEIYGNQLPLRVLDILKREMKKPENQPSDFLKMAHMATVSTPQTSQEINETLLNACYRACHDLYKEGFDALPPQVQMGYASDLYTLLARLCVSNGKDLAEVMVLEGPKLVDLLSIYNKLGWSRKFPIPPMADGCFF
ncbi:MAG: hypothetical protein Q8K43_02810 [Sulfurimicrobium sp.]|nr:hypothetical protein [Sulfurimicrobium sp.]